MKSRSIAVLALLLFLFGARLGYGVMVSPFDDIPAYAERGKVIVIARCVSIRHLIYMDGIYNAEVEVLQALKGGKTPVKRVVSTIYPMAEGKTYLLYDMGEQGNKIDAIPELSVVELPPDFDLKQLEGKSLTDQITAVFRARRDYLTDSAQADEGERKLLEKAVGVQAGGKGKAIKSPVVKQEATSFSSRGFSSDPVEVWIMYPKERDPGLELALVEVESVSDALYAYEGSEHAKAGVSYDGGKTYSTLMLRRRGKAALKVVEDPVGRIPQNLTVDFEQAEYVRNRREKWKDPEGVEPGNRLLAFFKKDGLHGWVLEKDLGEEGFFKPAEYLTDKRVAVPLQAMFRMQLVK